MKYRVLQLLKYIAIFLGVRYMLIYLTFKIFLVSDLSNIEAIISSISVISLFVTLAVYKAERTGIVLNAKTRRSKIKIILIILGTLGLILLFIKLKRRGLFDSRIQRR